MAKQSPSALSAEVLTPKIVAKKATYLVHIKGLGGLLMNKMPDLSQPKASKSQQAKEDPHEKELRTWKDKLYTNGDRVILRAEALHQCLQDGAKYWGAKIPGEGSKTFSNILKCGVVVEDADLGLTIDSPFIVPLGKNVNGTPTKPTAAMVYKIRPMVQSWEASFVMHVFDTGRLTPDVLATVLAHAGTFIGIGDWRPVYGRFEVVGLEEIP